MNKFIYWTNNNQGFVTAIFSALTVLFSGISVWIAIAALRNPLKKKLKFGVNVLTEVKLNGGMRNQSTFFDLSVANTGNRTVVIRSLTIIFNGKHIKSPNYFNQMEKKLNPGESQTLRFGMTGFTAQTRDIKLKRFENKIFGFAIDSEGKKYKSRIRKLEKYLKTKKAEI